MNSLENNSSPTFKNLKKSSRNSPIELKEKLRRKYKDKVQNCRDTLLTRFRGAIEESDLHSTLTEIYRDLFNFSDTSVNEEEVEVLEEIKQELVQEEVDWYGKRKFYFKVVLEND
ncbi:unnamed protein product [Diatraea saccharalis]|uniref:Uncharacterized protein n=1 Tax=Diatraea saccharalis TaxID=40085 RepID=A0A9N9W7A8_9NEOP|nr:unnamed protein product [Diatraea saccharalis]